MKKLWFHSFFVLWKCNPDLKSVHLFFDVSQFVGSSFRVYHTFSSSHPVDGTRFNNCIVSHTITMSDCSFKQKSQCGQSNMRMRSYVEIFSCHKLFWSHVVNKNKWSNVSFLFERQ